MCSEQTAGGKTENWSHDLVYDPDAKERGKIKVIGHVNAMYSEALNGFSECFPGIDWSRTQYVKRMIDYP